MRVLFVSIVLVAALALLVQTSQPSIFDDWGVGPSLGIGELTGMDPNHRFTTDPSITRRLKRMSGGDRVEIDYRSTGCFATLNYQFAVDRHQSGDYALSVRERPYGQWITRELDARTINALDRLLTFYRSAREGDCTIQDRIKVRWLSDGKTVGQELFLDASCASERVPGAVVLPNLRKVAG
jgi:hypothetical protein